MTPACVALDRAGVQYVAHPYEHDPSAGSYGLEAAEVLGVDPDVVFKTLMAKLDSARLVVAIVPVSAMLHLKALAAVFDAKKATMADVVEAERTSGYVVGGISPFGQRRPQLTAIDESALSCETIFVSGGRRGLDLELAPADLVTLLGATVTALTR